MSKARQLADLGNVYDDGALSNRNMVVNGGMTISQRNSSWSGLTASQYTLDRFSTDIGGGGAIDVAQSTTAADGFVNSMSLTVATADASIAAGDAYRVSHQIEGLNVGHLNWGSSSAQTVTLSFWVRSSITGTYGLGIANSAETENYVAEYIINSANTWEKKTVTVEGRTSGTWLTTNGIGLGIRWDLGSGTNYNGTAGSWQTTGSKVYRTSSCVNWIANAGATFYITGVQLEIGDTATPFEHRSYGDELARCQRYYQKIMIPQRKVGGAVPSVCRWEFQTEGEMRANPTCTLTATLLSTYSPSGDDLSVWGIGAVSTWPPTFSYLNSYGKSQIQLGLGTTSSNFTNGGLFELGSSQQDNGAFIAADAEL